MQDPSQNNTLLKTDSIVHTKSSFYLRPSYTKRYLHCFRWFYLLGCSGGHLAGNGAIVLERYKAVSTRAAYIESTTYDISLSLSLL